VNSDGEYDNFFYKYTHAGIEIKETKTTEGLEKERKEAEEQAELAELNKKKLKLDIKVGEQVVKSYPFTRKAAWTGLIISIILAGIEIYKLFKKSP
jgi:hypothetical protein